MIWVSLAAVVVLVAAVVVWMFRRPDPHGARRSQYPDRGDWPPDQMAP